MKPITTYSNWCYFDQLDGKNLEDGETLRLRFRDGTEKEIKISVECFEETISDMGSPCQIPHRKAYTALKVHGTEFKLPLVGLYAERV